MFRRAEDEEKKDNQEEIQASITFGRQAFKLNLARWKENMGLMAQVESAPTTVAN